MSNGDIVYSLSRDYVVDERAEVVTAIMNLSTGEVFRLENSGREILYLFIQGRTVEEIVCHVLKQYDIDRSRVLHDVGEILNQFLSMGVLEAQITNSDEI